MENIVARLEVKQLSDQGEFEGLASTFGNVDLMGDRIERGAFLESIGDPAKIKMLWHHDTREVIGVWDHLEETENGLLARGRLLKDVRRGAEVYTQMKEGALDGLSIGFSVPEHGAEIDPATRARVLTKIDLLEISPVTFPANPLARVTQVKASEIQDERAFELFLREAGFSKAFAVAVTCHGYRAASRRDDEGELLELGVSMKRLLSILDEGPKR